MSVKKGDPVRVRLSTGEVVEAVYCRPTFLMEKCHHVYIRGELYVALGGGHERRGVSLRHECRFVGPTPKMNKRGEQQ